MLNIRGENSEVRKIKQNMFTAPCGHSVKSGSCYVLFGAWNKNVLQERFTFGEVIKELKDIKCKYEAEACYHFLASAYTLQW